MTSRERVILAVNHTEPDRVPMDLGGTVMSGIMAEALSRLRKHLGLENHPVKVYDVFQMLGEVEMDLVQELDLDVLPLEPPALFFKIRRERYKPWTLFDGTEVLVPGDFRLETNTNGDWLLREGGLPENRVIGRMPRDGYYFDDQSLIHPVSDFQPPDLKTLPGKSLLTEEELHHLEERAGFLRKTTDKALLLGCWNTVGMRLVGSLPDFLTLIALDRDYVKELMNIRGEDLLQNLKLLWQAVGDQADIVGIDGFDFGSQRGELISPRDFEEIYFPHYRRANQWVHQHTTWKTWQHVCGSITRILPCLVESGLDIINPVQFSAAGMDPHWLKKTFGNALTFWGGGVDTQHILPFGTPEEVEQQVQHMISTLAPGGGFVFAPVHNIQYGTLPQNIEAAFRTARTWGKYPLNQGNGRNKNNGRVLNFSGTYSYNPFIRKDDVHEINHQKA